MNPIFLLGTLALISFLYWAAYQSARALKNRTVQLTGNLLLSIPEFFFKLLLLGICAGLATTLTVDRLDKYLNWPSTQPIVDILIGTTVGIATVFVINIFSVAAIRIWGKKIYSPELMKSLVPRNQLEWVLIMIPLLLAVTVEEVLFRALLIGGFSTVVNPWAMAVASSVIFGMMHSPQGTLGIVLTGLVGMLFGAVFILTNSLLAAIVAHFVVNILQIFRAKEDIAWYERFQEKAPAAPLVRKPSVEPAATPVTSNEESPVS